MNRTVKLTWIIITINLLIEVIMILSMFGVNGILDTFVEWPIIMIFSIATLYISGYFIGKKMDNEINLKKKNPYLTDIPGLFLILIIATFVGSTIGFLQYAVKDINSYYRISDAIFDYYFKPYFWILFFGVIPTLVTGIILSRLIKTTANTG
jgi:cytochrome c oxidase assembly factor CtaG